MKRYILSAIMIGFIFLASCKKDEKVSPDLRDISGPVVFTEDFKASTTTPNFANGDKVYFTAKFEKDASWVLTITGNTSGGKKIISGTGREILASVASWDGTATMPPSFRAEAVTAKLSFPLANSVSTTGALSIPITIVDKKDLNEGHVLITDFNVLQTKIKDNYDSLAWTTDDDLVNKFRWPTDWVTTVLNNDIPLKNPDGNKYCQIGPNPAWQDNEDFLGHKSPYIDLLRITAASVGYEPYFPLIADPNKTYFNLMMYNNSKDSKTNFQITLYEKDAAFNDVQKTYNIRPRWEEGWKVVSIPYSNFKLEDTTEISNNPQRITGLELVLLSDDSQEILDAGSNPVQARFDHLIFTHYKPYQP